MQKKQKTETATTLAQYPFVPPARLHKSLALCKVVL